MQVFARRLGSDILVERLVEGRIAVPFLVCEGSSADGRWERQVRQVSSILFGDAMVRIIE